MNKKSIDNMCTDMMQKLNLKIKAQAIDLIIQEVPEVGHIIKETKKYIRNYYSRPDFIASSNQMYEMFLNGYKKIMFNGN